MKLLSTLYFLIVEFINKRMNLAKKKQKVWNSSTPPDK
ncbi:hypothetical protein LD85_2560 [Saccharolobus islandicus L.D.8.5]|uniref:Uncharacterized protein n=1 Tax=Saccharolobus islandicus (strain L.D.8.5 / Lassen \|nr:hypothetical protein LD85_2560 [Sulfolobus islandicus L.D.8.5]